MKKLFLSTTEFFKDRSHILFNNKTKVWIHINPQLRRTYKICTSNHAEECRTTGTGVDLLVNTFEWAPKEYTLWYTVKPRVKVMVS